MAVAQVRGGCALLIGIDDERELVILLPKGQALEFTDKLLDYLAPPDDSPTGAA